MKQFYKHALLTLLLGATAATAGAATGDIINEDFSGFTGLYANSSTTEKNGWTVHGCATGSGLYAGGLIFGHKGTSCSNSYITSPLFTKPTDTCNAIITFRYVNTNKDKNASFSVTINGGGTFPDGKKNWSTTIPSGSTIFNTATLKLISVSASSYVTIKLTSKNEEYFALDDVVISTADQVTLRDDAANDVETKVADVTVGRTLTGGIWNTLCLPFDTRKNTIAQATGNAVEDVSLRTFSGYSDNTLTFESADTVYAGIPFLIKLAETSVDPKFPLADLKGNITAETRTVTFNGASMTGVFDPTDIGSTGLFLTASGTLKKANSNGSTMKGLRAYFTVPSGASARLALDDDATAIRLVETTATADRWYTTDGRQLSMQPTRRGIYIRNGQKMIIR